MSDIVEGVLSVDKPAGLTSHDVVKAVRRLADNRRVGHAGTLDPLATGLLLLCLGRATRLIEYLVGLTKVYSSRIRLGQETDTYDAAGEVLEERPVSVTRQDIEQVLPRFRGEISQTPPMFSAVKHEGQPLYKLARRGEKVERPPRQVTIFELELVEWDSPYLELLVTCSSGTYVRSLAHDLGRALGCGGHVVSLRRSAIGDFRVEDAVSLDKLEAQKLGSYILPADAAVGHLPRLVLPGTEARKLFLGQAAAFQPVEPAESLYRAYDEAGQFVGVVLAVEDGLRPRKIFYRPEEAPS